MTIIYFVALFALLPRAAAQVPKETTGGRLQAALLAIQDTVNEQGEISYTMVSHNKTLGGNVQDQYSVKTWDAVATQGSCSLQVDARMSMNGRVQVQGRAKIQFRDVSLVAVKTQSQIIRERTAQIGVTEWIGVVTPESYAVQVFGSGRLLGMLFVRDRDTAFALANTINRVIELCGNKNASK